MAETSDFHLGADVMAADGRKVGMLLRVIVEEDGFDPRALVVKEDESFAGRLRAAESLLISDEVVIPIAAVESATHDVVKLSMSAADIRHQPPYLSHHFKRLTLETAALDEAQVLTLGVGVPSVDETANKAPGEIEIDQGESVMLGTTGRRLGRVQDVLFDQSELIGVVIRPEGFFKRDVVLPIRFISRADDLALFAHLSESDIQQLKPFVEPEP
ncbi:MAG TPA: PRC-barrel domain-containing protein [Candidatus Dormibacteraeota bacterium]|nr:PRC-barrel domain-containing protein [Candidatus Dormibacteraeota bacterium]